VVKTVAKQFEPALIPGEWYLRYTCPNCQAAHILFRDLTRGAAPIRATYFIECPACRLKETYESQDIERYQHLES